MVTRFRRKLRMMMAMAEVKKLHSRLNMTMSVFDLLITSSPQMVMTRKLAPSVLNWIKKPISRPRINDESLNLPKTRSSSAGEEAATSSSPSAGVSSSSGLSASDVASNGTARKTGLVLEVMIRLLGGSMVK
jgi:hypothetical protein